MKRIAFIVQLPKNISPGQRFRFEQYEPLLTAHGYQVETFSFLDADVAGILYKKGFLMRKVTGVLKGFGNRIFLLGKLRRFDFIFLQREFAPIGPPVFEWVVSRLLKCRIVYDFDDAIWIANVSEGNKLARFFKSYWKIGWICKWSYKVSVGNAFLADYARQYNRNVIYNPTCVDTEGRYNKLAALKEGPVTIGWTGSHSTLQFLALAVPALQKLEQSLSFRLLVICDKKPDFHLASMEFVPWNRDSEIEDLLKMDIGIMPLKEDAWSEGKCGFKIIQYMALGIPAVASPVGVNKEIIDHGVNGYLSRTSDEWVAYLTELVQNEQKRMAFGKSGRKKIVENYSIASNAATFLSLFSN